MDLFLKTETKEQMEKALEAAGFQQEDGVFYKEGCSLIVIGVLQKVVSLDEDFRLETLEGFHANLRTESEEVVSALLQHNSSPKTPQLTWLD